VKHWIDKRTGKPKIIYQLCADTGSDTKYYAQNGYDVRLIGSKIGIENVHGHSNVYGIVANPVCTHFSIARTHLAKIPRSFQEGMKLVKECLRFIWECQYNPPGITIQSNLKFWVIENPATGALKNFLGKPAFEYCPSEYGADYTKRTALWGMFIPPPKEILRTQLTKGKSVKDLNAYIKGNRNLKEAMEKRSECYDGFAKLFYYANP